MSNGNIFNGTKSSGRRVGKFGGSSLSNAKWYTKAANIVKKFYKPGDIVVVSAVGIPPGTKGVKTTDQLIDLAQTYFSGTTHSRIIDIESKHDKIIQSLNLPETTLHRSYQRLDKQLKTKKKRGVPFDVYHDMFAPEGECLSAEILAALINSDGNVKAKVLYPHEIGFRLSGNHRDGRITREGQRNLANSVKDDDCIYIMPGYYGVDNNGNWITMGRGGSDATAGAVAVAINAMRCDIWTDVDGIYRANPNYFEQTKEMHNILRVNRMDYGEGLPMAEFGATVIHPGAIGTIMLSDNHTPIYIRKTADPNGKFTIISDVTEYQDCGYKGIVDCKLKCVTLTNPKMVGAYGYSADFLAAFAKHRVPIKNHTDSSASMSVYIDKDINIEGVLKELERSRLGRVDVGYTGFIGVYGDELKGQAGMMADVTAALRDADVNIVSSVQEQEQSMRFMVSDDKREAGVKAIYQKLEERLAA